MKSATDGRCGERDDGTTTGASVAQRSYASASSTERDSATVRLVSQPAADKATALHDFLKYLKANGLQEEDFTVDEASFPRYFRLNPLFPADDSLLAGQPGGVLSLLAEHFGQRPELVKWLPTRAQVYRVASTVKLTSSELYNRKENARMLPAIFGIDASSCAAVAALDPRPGDSVLDLCCAPGAKLSFLANYMEHQGSLTGVDLSAERLRSTWKMLVRYGIADAASQGGTSDGGDPWRVRVFQADGTTFHELSNPAALSHAKASSHGTSTPGSEISGHRQERNLLVLDSLERNSWAPQRRKSLKMTRQMRRRLSDRTYQQQQATIQSVTPVAKRPRRQRESSSQALGRGTRDQIHVETTSGAEAAGVSSSPVQEVTSPLMRTTVRQYDKVLVDAECTHDGSVRHLSKFKDWGWHTFRARVMDQERLAYLPQLQRKLLLNGFRLLKPGGGLVYSTCSLCRAQNEDIVQWFLSQPSVIASKTQLVAIEFQGALEPIPRKKNAGSPESSCQSSSLAMRSDVDRLCLRLSPTSSRTSGLFVAKFYKPLMNTADTHGATSHLTRSRVP